MSYGGYGQQDPFADVGPHPGSGAVPGYGAGQAPGYPAGAVPAYPPGYAPQPYGSYGAPGGAPEPDNDRRLFGLLAIALGLLGFVLSFITAIYILAAILAAVGVIFAFASLVKEPTAKGFAVTGMVAGFAGLAVAAVQLIVGVLSSL